ncbi:glycosyltransferase family 2 protein [Phocaeicola vulgatus]|uniref:glycosyltransferase family 2 protein n=1 Tax=Phocaeicola vulgatus TaxID=821 RepID=UPI00125CB646|nr:glycosyltransferase [Phocaeicola vulgatus]KAB5414412.1 glycosyltransferase [Phocaeicola vulgatus]
MDKISVIIPVYKVANYIYKCALSLFMQTYQNVEYIFVNDCSPDESMHIPADTRSAFPVISVQSPVSIQCCWQS